MSIEIRCPSCNKLLKAKDSLAGKRVKCPSCGDPIDIPNPEDEVYDAEVVPDEPDPWASLPDEHDQSADDEPPKKACPMCGEMIPVTAKRCRFCGEVFGKKKKKKSSGGGGGVDWGGDEDTMGIVDWILVFCLPGCGCLFGIVYACQGKSKGAKMIGLAFLFGFLWNVISFALRAMQENM